MSFYQENEESYTKNTRYYLNTDDGETTPDGSKRYTIPEIRDVISIENNGYYIPNDAIPTFVARNGSNNGNNVFELRMFRSDTLVEKTFFIEFDERRFLPSDEISFDPDISTRDLALYMESKISRVLVEDPDFGDPGGASDILDTPPNRFYVYVFEIDGEDRKYEMLLEFSGENEVTATVLFGTGVRKSDSCGPTLGYAEEDLVFEDFDEVYGENPITFQIGKYIDLRIKEARQYIPNNRIFIQESGDVYNEDYKNKLPYQTYNDLNKGRTRVITSNPPFRLRGLTIGLFIDGKHPIPVSVQCHLEIVLLSVSNETEVPEWADSDVLSL